MLWFIENLVFGDTRDLCRNAIRGGTQARMRENMDLRKTEKIKTSATNTLGVS